MLANLCSVWPLVLGFPLTLMVFNSLPFLFAFLPVTLRRIPDAQAEDATLHRLTVTGNVFYASWNYKFCALMAFSTLVAYVAGLGLLRWEDRWRRRMCLTVPSTDLALLGFFGYSNFVLDTTNLHTAPGVAEPLPHDSGGLWHGASWTFVVWGGYHGLLLILNRHLSERWGRVPSAAREVVTFVLFVIGWVFFPFPTFTMAATLLREMFVWHSGTGMVREPLLLAMLVLAASIAQFSPNTFEMRHDWRPLATTGLLILFALSLFAICGNRSTPFLYLQF